MWNSGFQFNFTVNNVKLWYPKNHGKPNLYKTQVELLYKNNTVDTNESILSFTIIFNIICCHRLFLYFKKIYHKTAI